MNRKHDTLRWSVAGVSLAGLLVALGLYAMPAQSSQQAVTAQASYGQSNLTCAIDAGGYCTVPHSLGVKPTAVDVIAVNGQTSIDPNVTTATATGPGSSGPTAPSSGRHRGPLLDPVHL